MATDVERLLLQIDANSTLLRQELGKARGEIDKFGTGAERSANRASNAIEGIGTSATTSLKSLAGFAAGLLSIQQSASFLVRTNAEFQKLSAMMEVATGSTSAAASAMKQLEGFAAETPFTLNQVVEAYVRLKNMGLDPSIESMRSFGNTSAAMGKDIMQFIEAIADAATGEFERLKEFGIKASQEGDKVKFTFQGVTTTVDKNAQAITEYLRKLGDESGIFAGAMSKQMDTIGGKLSNLDDAASRLAVTIGKLGFSDFFMRQLDRLVSGLEAANVEIQGLARIKALEGTGAAMNATQDEKIEAGTTEGMRNRLTRQANLAMNERIRIEQARERGDMFAGGQSALDRARKSEAETTRRLRQFEAGNFVELDPMARAFPLNERGGLGVAAPNKPPPPPKGTGKPTKAPAPTWLQQAMGGSFDTPAPAFNAELAFAAELPEARVNLEAMFATLADMQELPPIQPIDDSAFLMAEQFSEQLSRNLGQALVFGQSLGDALKNSIRAAAAELITSGLLDLLLGGKGAGGVRTGGVLASIFGGFRADGGPVSPGKAYMVGERGPEMIIPKASGYVIPNGATMGGGGGGPQQVMVSVAPSPLFITSVVEGSRAATADTMRRGNRQRMPASAGA